MSTPTRIYVVRSSADGVLPRAVQARTASEAERYVTRGLYEAKPVSALELAALLRQYPALQIEDATSKGAQ